MNQTFVLPPEPAERERIAGNLHAFLLKALPGKRVKVTVEPYRRTRSNEQNRALWGLAYRILAEATGHQAEDLHEFFLGEYFGWDVIEVMGQKRRVPKRRSHTMTTIEFADFYTFIQQRAAEIGFDVPNPNE